MYNCRDLIERTLPTVKEGEASKKTLSQIKAVRESFDNAMEDDFNTADAISAIFELVRIINTALTSETTELTKGDVKAYQDEYSILTNVLGLLYNSNNDEIPAEVQTLAEQRKEARKAKNFALADELRNKITEMGYVVEETRQGTIIKKA